MVPLSTLPEILVFGILFKMPPTTLVCMRRSCSFMNEIVEENQEKLSQRSRIGIDLILFQREQLMFSRHTQLVLDCTKISRKEIVDESLEQKFSGIAINDISIRSRHQTHNSNIIGCLKKLQSKCKALQFADALLEEIILNQPLAAFEVTFSLSNEQNITTNDMKSTAKKFLKVIMCTTPDKFVQLLWDIYRSSKEITIAEICLYVEIIHLPLLFPFCSESTPTLYDLGKPFVAPPQKHKKGINHLRLLTTPSKFVLIGQLGGCAFQAFNGRLLFARPQRILFLDRNESSLAEALVDLKFVHEFPENRRQEELASVLSKISL